MDTPKLTEAQEEWARKIVGSMLRHQMSGQHGRAVSWEPGKNGTGAWFITSNGLRIYRQFPKRLREGFQTSD